MGINILTHTHTRTHMTMYNTHDHTCANSICIHILWYIHVHVHVYMYGVCHAPFALIYVYIHHLLVPCLGLHGYYALNLPLPSVCYIQCTSTCTWIYMYMYIHVYSCFLHLLSIVHDHNVMPTLSQALCDWSVMVCVLDTISNILSMFCTQKLLNWLSRLPWEVQNVHVNVVDPNMHVMSSPLGCFGRVTCVCTLCACLHIHVCTCVHVHCHTIISHWLSIELGDL